MGWTEGEETREEKKNLDAEFNLHTHWQKEDFIKERKMETSSPKAWLALLSFGVLLIAIFLRLFHHEQITPSSAPLNDASSLEAILAGLLRLESQATQRQLSSPQHPARVAVGFGACKDVFARALPLFRRFGASPPPPEKELDHHASIADKTQLEEGVAYFFRHGAAAERYVSDKRMFRELVHLADELPGVRHVLGGNAPVMANRIATEGGVVLLAARLSEELRAGMHERVATVKYDDHEGKEEGEEEMEDDIHLILEYAKDEAWEHLVAPRANRYIVHSDADNPWITSLEPLVVSIVYGYGCNDGRRLVPEIKIGLLYQFSNFTFLEDKI